MPSHAAPLPLSLAAPPQTSVSPKELSPCQLGLVLCSTLPDEPESDQNSVYKQTTRDCLRWRFGTADYQDHTAPLQSVTELLILYSLHDTRQKLWMFVLHYLMPLVRVTHRNFVRIFLHKQILITNFDWFPLFCFLHHLQVVTLSISTSIT